jgi:hypothetical protein
MAMSLRRVDVHDPELIPVEAIALQRMLDKREQYVSQGRTREAHGAGSMISILWDTLKGEFQDTQPTHHGDL